MDEETLQQVERIIGYQFSDRGLLVKALTHASSVENRLLSNERLEFLGDAVLAIVICEVLFEQFDDYLEGNLTKIKSMLVSRGTCSRLCNSMGLNKHLVVGKGMVSSRALTGSLAAGVLEATIAAVYLDGGYHAAKEFILKCFGPLLERADAEHSQGNFKSVLQQYSQEHMNMAPVYVLLDEKGPDHDKCFELGVVLGEHHFPSAWGSNKKQAEQKAAFNALVELGVIKEPAQAEGRGQHD
ncbi:MAG: ribonuclease III [Sedimentisphaerales bacterium]|nr:ribonuclease III [Sedimentisphaerales bacterium]